MPIVPQYGPSAREYGEITARYSQRFELHYLVRSKRQLYGVQQPMGMTFTSLTLVLAVTR